MRAGVCESGCVCERVCVSQLVQSHGVDVVELERRLESALKDLMKVPQKHET